MTESPKSKGQRFILFAVLAVIVALFVVPLGAYGSSYISGSSHSVILEKQSVPLTVWGEKANNTTNVRLPFSVVNYTSTITSDYSYLNATNQTKVGYYATNYILTNVTIGELNLHDANKYIVQLAVGANISAILGYGSEISNSTFSFSQMATASLKGNASQYGNLTFNLTPAMLTGNQSSQIIVELQFGSKSSVATYSEIAFGEGSTSVTNSLLTGENVAYAFGGTLLFISGFLAMPWHDISIRRMRERVKTTKTGRKAKKSPEKGKK